MNRKKQLEDFIKALEKLIVIPRKDKYCQWSYHFESCLNNAIQLRDHGFEQKDLNLLSASAMSVFRGAGSFSDYAPVLDYDKNRTFKVIHGMEDLSNGSNLVFASAVELRATEKDGS